jgi:hypothetical protein
MADLKKTGKGPLDGSNPLHRVIPGGVTKKAVLPPKKPDTKPKQDRSNT